MIIWQTVQMEIVLIQLSIKLHIRSYIGSYIYHTGAQCEGTSHTYGEPNLNCVNFNTSSPAYNHHSTCSRKAKSLYINWNADNHCELLLRYKLGVCTQIQKAAMHLCV